MIEIFVNSKIPFDVTVINFSGVETNTRKSCVCEALLLKADATSEVGGDWKLAARAYKYKTVKVVQFARPLPQCTIYMDLKREECGRLFPSGTLYSQGLLVQGQTFFLSAHCNLDLHTGLPCFGLFLGMQDKGTVAVNVTVDYEFSVRTKPSGDFLKKHRGNYTFNGGKAIGVRNLLSVPWTIFMAHPSIFFIDEVLHIRVEFTIRQP